MNSHIEFGTDGWRSVIADGFTFTNVRRVTQAACDVLRKTSKSRLLLIGYDRRFFSKRFAETAARVAVGNGFKVEISSDPIGSPTLSYQVKNRRAAAGFMITASHNPFQFNGFKIKGPHGGSVDETVTRLIEERIDAGDIRDSNNALKTADFHPGYFSDLKKRVPSSVIHKLKSPIVFDAMHGPGGRMFQSLLPKNSKILYLRDEPDPLFGGASPEPIEPNLTALKEAVIANKAGAGIAVDGDVDRIGVVDNFGRYLPPHTVMPLLLLHLIENRKLKGKVVQTVSMGYLPARIAREFKLPFEEVSVGFKHIAQRIISEKVLLGGEESGGYGVGLWAPERDGLVCALLLIELLAKEKSPLSELVEKMMSRFGKSNFKRVDFPLDHPVPKEAWTNNIQTHLPEKIGGLAVRQVLSFDGIKVFLEDDSWVLMRPSGTEPLIRTYAESPDIKLMDALIAEADRLVHIPIPSPDSGRKESGKKRVKNSARTPK